MSAGSGLATRVLDDVQHAFYRSNGYLVVADVVPSEFLLAAQRLLERVVDETIAAWQRDELIDDTFETLDFGCRFHRALRDRTACRSRRRASLVSREMREWRRHWS